jgi:hypothetical protein
LIDKNSLWDELNIQKGELCVKGLYHNMLGLFENLFSGDAGPFRERGDEGALSTISRCLAGIFEAHAGTPVASAPYSPSFITTESKHPRGSPAFRGVKVIVTYGDLREMIQDVFGRRGFNSLYPAPNSDSNDFESSLKKSRTFF